MAFFLKNSIIKLLKFNNLKEVRSYARWSHRRPRRVLTNEESDDLNQIEDHSTKNETKQLPQRPLKSNWIPVDLKSSLEPKVTEKEGEKMKKRKKQLKIQTPMSKETVDMLETVINAEGNLVYTKLKNNDRIISQLLLTVKSRRQQIKQDLALLEGKRLIKEALQAKCILKNLIFSRVSDLEDLKAYLPKTGARILKMPYREIQIWSDLSTTPGIMGIFKTPLVENYISHNSLPITVICDNIREPGNLGAILRTAAGVGINSVILTKGCVDLWDTKVLRSACGAHFHLQIYKKMDWPDIERHLQTSNSAVFVADNKIITEQSENNTLDIIQDRSLQNIVLSMPLLPYYGVQFNNYKSLALVYDEQFRMSVAQEVLMNNKANISIINE
ncbi:hypothetical protein RN001_012633 [Aquatica leii]|uniref:tRNA/rRNA methyltransferase SpoU type domain-containing protein n=1 Tax=Aquatica leii TaxID=1421715 RepID=A0AAN7S7V3_9COLE|nr:hypothetical protein RN001_012633 [Aquatica leii]